MAFSATARKRISSLPIVGEVTSVMTMEKEKNPGFLDQLVIQVTRLYEYIGLGEATKPFKECVEYLEGTLSFFEKLFCETVFISK